MACQDSQLTGEIQLNLFAQLGLKICYEYFKAAGQYLEKDFAVIQKGQVEGIASFLSPSLNASDSTELVADRQGREVYCLLLGLYRQPEKVHGRYSNPQKPKGRSQAPANSSHFIF